MSYSKESAALRRQQEVERLQQMLTEGIQNYLTGDRYTTYLDSVAKFHQYSAHNSMLITMQNPDATTVASFLDWKHKFHRHVKAGEHGIRIIAPITRRRTDPEREDESEGREPAICGFRAATVFDVSQTEGRPLPDIISTLTEKVPNYGQIAAAAQAITDFRIEEAELPGEVYGICRPHSRTISVQSGLSESMAIKTILHEIAHQKLHTQGPLPPRDVRELQAESVAYVVCAHLGIDAGDYSFGYLISWGAADRPKYFDEAMPAVVYTARGLIEEFDRQLGLVQAEAPHTA